RAVARPRTISTIVGAHDAVAAFWDVVGGAWDDVRELRWRQPHMIIDHETSVAPDPEVRRSVRADFGALYPACVAMYEEEIGVSPEAAGGR
ncbi:DUF4081 domain-containing protein, partial [Xylella fastidiosa subsp. multiplex]|uniref:DUF4081 domain-containing protein n=1 Tax=Xylella fastidiosa TaxID=2371 RepID=UPI0012ADFDFE